MMLVICAISRAQLVVNNTLSPTQLVQDILLGPGIDAYNVTATGCVTSSTSSGDCIGNFSNGNTTNLGLSAGVVMCAGSIFDIPNAASANASIDNGGGSDPQLASLVPGYTIYDATVLEFDFIPNSPQVTFRYVFGSEEYPEYVGSSYNDAFGFFLSGPNPGGGNYTNVNLAKIPGTTLPVTINNVNAGSYSQYYVSNSGVTIVYDGFTTVLTATAQVTPCMTYHIKIAIGDAGDHVLDSGIFLEAGSFSGGNSFSVSSASSNPTLSNNAIENCSDGIVTFNMDAPQSNPTTITFTIGGSATNGVDYTTIPTSVTIPAGATSTTLTIHPVQDALTEGDETVQLIVSTPPCGYDTVVVTIQDNPEMAVTVNPDMTICSGDQVNLNATVTGGLSPYSYLWSNGTATAANTVYPVGNDITVNYSVTATDACFTQVSDAVDIFVDDCTPCSANAGHDAKICGLTFDLQAITQPGDYNTYWTSVSPGATFSTSSSPTTSVTVPAFGTYSFVWNVTNVANISCSDTVNIIFAPVPTSTFTITPIMCFSDSTVVTYTGNAPASAIYTWNFGGGTAVTAPGQECYYVEYGNQGTFNVSLYVDDDGCISNTTTNNVTSPSLLQANVNVQSVQCASGNNGSVSIDVTGGTQNYNYLWSNGATPPTVAGSYTVTVTDAQGCTVIQPFEINEPTAIVTTETHTNLTCFNNASGIATVSVTGGQTPYIFDWPGLPNSTATQNNLQAGLFIVTITDGNGCVINQTLTIQQPAELLISIPALNNVSCNGGENGNITALGTGGTPPLNFTIGEPLQLSGTFSSLNAGNYNVTVVDANTCNTSTSFTIAEPSAVTILTETSGNIPCYGLHNGTISVTATGGTGALAYSIGGATQAIGDFNGLYPGSYTVTVMDANGCNDVGTTFTITQPSLMVIDSIRTTNLNCYLANNGTGAIYVSGGIPPYTFTSGGISQSTGVYSNLPAGTYNVAISDYNGCTIQSGPIFISQPPQLLITSQNATNISCFGYTASVAVVAAGGTSPLTYSIGGAPQANGYFIGLHGGTYTVTVTDGNGCSINSNTFNINEPTLMFILDSSYSDISCFNAQNGMLAVTPTGGTPPYQYNIIPAAYQTSNTFSNLAPGNYVVTVTDNNGCRDSAHFTLSQPTVLIIDATSTDVKCNGGNDGTLAVTVNGGVVPYNLFWSNGATSYTVSDVASGIYFVSVTDANNCSISDTVIISQPQPMYITTSSDTVICRNTQAVIHAQATGGTSPYIYMWNGTQGMSTITVNTADPVTYQVYAMDVNGCFSDTAATNIAIYPNVVFNAFAQQDSVCSGSSTLIYGDVSGGNGGPYVVYDESMEIINFPYSVIPITDHSYVFYAGDLMCGISARDTVLIRTIPIPSVLITADKYKGCQPFTVNFFATTDQVCETFLWNFGESSSLSYSQNPQHTYTSSGVYDVSVIATSEAGCSVYTMLSQFITVYPKPDARFNFDPSVASMLKPIIYFTNLSTPNTTNTWSFGDGDSSSAIDPIHTYHAPGIYNPLLIVSTIHNCKDTVSYQVVIKDEVTFYAPSAFSPDLDGINDIFKIVGHGIDEATFEMWIYDRWGETIYNTKDINKGWDGGVKGKEKGKVGSYVWMVSFNDFTGKKHVKSGYVTMIR